MEINQVPFTAYVRSRVAEALIRLLLVVVTFYVSNGKWVLPVSTTCPFDQFSVLILVFPWYVFGIYLLAAFVLTRQDRFLKMLQPWGDSKMEQKDPEVCRLLSLNRRKHCSLVSFSSWKRTRRMSRPINHANYLRICYLPWISCLHFFGKSWTM